MATERAFGEIDHEAEASIEDADWCQFPPSHDGRWVVDLGKTDPKWNCPMIEIFCDGHVEQFFIGCSQLLSGA